MVTDTSTSRALWFADAWFRGWGVAALGALAGTAVMLALRIEAWRVPFIAAHLAALFALVPLGLALLARTFTRYYHQRRSFTAALPGTLTHDRVATALVVVALLGVAVSLSQFDGGVRWLRSTANFTTVAAIAASVWRYLRS